MRAIVKEGKSASACFIDFQKNFTVYTKTYFSYSLNLYKQLLMENSTILRKTLYIRICVEVNHRKKTNCSLTPFGPKQENKVSTILFALFLLQTAQEIELATIWV